MSDVYMIANKIPYVLVQNENQEGKLIIKHGAKEYDANPLFQGFYILPEHGYFSNEEEAENAIYALSNKGSELISVKISKGQDYEKPATHFGFSG